MFNLPIKLSVMSTPYDTLSPQAFLDKSPEACMQIFKTAFPESLWHTVAFAFSDTALLLMLEKEFEVRTARREMVFLKSTLDTESWLLANGVEEAPELPQDNDLLEEVTELMWRETAQFSHPAAGLEDRLSVRRELKTLLALYLQKYGRNNQQLLISMKSAGGRRQFYSLVVAEALYKADAAKVLFGRDNLYTRLWQQKQVEYLHYATLCAPVHLLKRSA